MENGVTNKPKIKYGCLFILILLIILIIWGVVKLFEKPLTYEERRKLEMQEELKNRMHEFVSDTTDTTNFKAAKYYALDIIESNPISKESEVCKKWLVSKGLNIESELIERKRMLDSTIEENKKKYSTDIKESESINSDNDELHTVAFMIAKDFIKERLKSPSTANFDYDYSWKVLGNKTYIIISNVDAQNSFGAKLKNKFYVKLKFKGGEDVDIKNWELIDLNLSN